MNDAIRPEAIDVLAEAREAALDEDAQTNEPIADRDSFLVGVGVGIAKMERHIAQRSPDFLLRQAEPSEAASFGHYLIDHPRVPVSPEGLREPDVVTTADHDGTAREWSALSRALDVTDDVMTSRGHRLSSYSNEEYAAVLRAALAERGTEPEYDGPDNTAGGHEHWA